jgi:hypothetical protein
MLGTPELVIFGIKTGIKLAQQGRHAYVEATINRELVLPLPNFNPEVSIGIAEGYFHGTGNIHLRENCRIKELVDISLNSIRSLTGDEKNEIIDAYADFKREDDIRSGRIKGDELALSNEALLSLVSVRQWARNKSPYPSGAQRIAGTLIEAGIDYYADMPGAIDERSASGRALRGFLKSIDEMDFAEERVGEIARKLFVAAIETVGENPDLLGADSKTEKLVEVTAKGLVKNVQARIAALRGSDLSKQEKVEEWAQLILRSVLGSVGEEVLASPGVYLNVGDTAQQEVISSVGTSVLDVIIDEDSVDLTRVLSRESLDRVIRAALLTLSEYPELMGVDNKGLQNILSRIARDLAGVSEHLGPDIIPEVMRLVLEKTAYNADLVWPDDFRDPDRHLLITASGELLRQLSRGEWKLRLARGQVLEVLDAVLDDVIENPAWLIEKIDDGDTVLLHTVETALTVLRQTPQNRVSSQTGVKVMLSVIKAVGMRRDLIDKIPIKGDQKVAVAAVLEIIVDKLLVSVDAKAGWTLARGELFSAVTSAVMEKLAETGVSEAILNKIEVALDESAQDLASGKSWSLRSLTGKIRELTTDE